MITAKTRVIIDAEEICTWGEFVQANEDGFSQAELNVIEQALENGSTYCGGGGAAAEFSLRLV